jgi:hypothetical protein
MQSRFNTVQEVEQDLAGWFAEHNPRDEIRNLNMHMFVFDPDMEPTFIRPEGVGLKLRKHAYNQLLLKLGIPRDFAQKFMSTGDTAAAGNIFIRAVNYMIQNGKQKNGCLFRMIDSSVIRAIQSDRYEAFDNLQLVKDLIPFTEGTTVRWHHFDDEIFHLSFTLPSTRTEVRVGDIVEIGVHVSNSEVGLRSVTIAPYIYRLSCRNGMIGKSEDIYRFRHVGDGDRLGNLVKGAIDATWQTATGLVDRMRTAVNKVIDAPMSYLESFAKRNDITQGEFQNMMDSLLTSGEDNGNLFGLSQSVSFTANRLEGEEAYKYQQYSTLILHQGM